MILGSINNIRAKFEGFFGSKLDKLNLTCLIRRFFRAKNDPITDKVPNCGFFNCFWTYIRNHKKLVWECKLVQGIIIPRWRSTHAKVISILLESQNDKRSPSPEVNFLA